jgi:integrase
MRRSHQSSPCEGKDGNGVFAHDTPVRQRGYGENGHQPAAPMGGSASVDGAWEYGLRHSFGSQAVTAGVPLNVVQQWMGHSTITMTMRYAHLAPDGGAKWIALLAGQREPDVNGVASEG